MGFPKLTFIKRLVGWFFTFPAYRDITPEQSEGVIALLTLALHADGEPEETEREELERELTGVPHYWADVASLRRVVARVGERSKHEDFDALVAEVVPAVVGLDPAFLLAGAAYICHGDHRLTELERSRLASMGRALGVADIDVERIIRSPAEAGTSMFESPDIVENSRVDESGDAPPTNR